MFKKIIQNKWFPGGAALILISLTLVSRICAAYFLATDEPGDGRVYTLLAKNLIEQNIFSLSTAPPFAPTLVRLPGYPLFIAAIYSIFGVGNDLAVRITQGVFDTATCVIVAYLAWLWTGDEERRRRNAFWTFLLISVCPFILIYAATLLTETLTTFLMAAMTLTATFAFQSLTFRKQFWWWLLTGILAGAAVFMRPDGGLFAAAAGLTLVVSGLFFRLPNAPIFFKRFLSVSWKGAVFMLGFILVLAPWTIRNYRVFGVIQPLAPAHGEMPGEFVPFGYQRWVRTWADDSRFVETTLWNLNEKPIRITRIPAQTFDSTEERERVAALLEQYNNPPGSNNQNNPAKSDDSDNDDADSDEDANSGDDKSVDSADEDKSASNDADKSADDSSNDQSDDDDDDDENKTYVVKMTPEIDAGFGALADERIARSPFRYYAWLPFKRAAALWFDSHSLYYSFGGQMSPIENLDYDVSQQYWLPLFTVLMWIYTLPALAGARLMWRARENLNTFRWLILLGFLFFLRLGFFATVENPEPRYVVELFALTAILGGFFLGSLSCKKSKIKKIVETNLPPPERLLSLDVFRGVTIAAMILVNNPGTWDAIYPPLEHAAWNGITPTDLIFPFFLFIVGVSVSFSLGKFAEGAKINRRIYFKIFKRAALLFALGFLLEVFPFYNIWKAAWFEPSTVRISGVLQRIAVCYFVSALTFLRSNWKNQLIIVAAILLIYWALMSLINVPGCDVTSINDKFCNLSAYLDRLILTENHIWNQSKVYDPEGILSTLPAIATTLVGLLTGTWLKSRRATFEKLAGIFVSGVVLTAVGWIWSFWLPLNKNLWASSYVVYTAGLALCFLGFFYWLVDLKNYRKWSKPFVIFGTNAIALYIGSTMMGTVLIIVELAAPNETTISLQDYIFKNVFLPLAAPINASLLFAVVFVLIWLFLLWLLYRKRIFIKI